MFRGVIEAGSTVEATFSSDFSNAGASHLLVSDGVTSDSDTTAPGGAARVRLQDLHEGLLEILLDVKRETDGGRLAVAVNGVKVDDEPVAGDNRWAYSVESPAREA